VLSHVPSVSRNIFTTPPHHRAQPAHIPLTSERTFCWSASGIESNRGSLHYRGGEKGTQGSGVPWLTAGFRNATKRSGVCSRMTRRFEDRVKASSPVLTLVATSLSAWQSDGRYRRATAAEQTITPHCRVSSATHSKRKPRGVATHDAGRLLSVTRVPIRAVRGAVTLSSTVDSCASSAPCLDGLPRGGSLFTARFFSL
jgi:hypothetical protein